MMMVWELSISALVVAGSSVYIFLVIFSPKAPIPAASESTYRSTSTSATTDEPQQLSLIHDPAMVELSVVVPAYNERERLGIMLNEAVEYLETCSLIEAAASDSGTSKEAEEGEDSKRKMARRLLPDGVVKGSYEILIIDDGSHDGTSEIALELASELEERWSSELSESGKKVARSLRGTIKVVTLVRNRGKGGSVKHGMLHASGDRILFVDADGASYFPDLALLQAELDQLETIDSKTATAGGYGLVVGSRAHLVQTDAVVKRSFVRNLLMRFFHTYLFILGIRAIRDTQCGFKLHTRRTAAHLYPYMHSPAWIFDCELLLLASLSNIPAGEVGIRWKEVGGSKVDLVKDSIAMAIDLLVIRGNYWTGRWESPRKIA